jgi:Rps23 Pro-64 3,4-dihydroxylase Tpa1-like proline 4-hydroxylase
LFKFEKNGVVNRKDLSSYIVNRLIENKEAVRIMYSETVSKIGYFFIDDLLPEEVVLEMYEVFPSPQEMVLKKSIRQDKYVAAQMNNYDPLLEEIIYAFQEQKVVELIGDICQIKNPIPDEFLYAGGISMMGKNQFLNPHLDNSHDKDRDRWRVLNLLFYVTPEWHEEYGGNLELWPDGLSGKQITIHSKFNRLVVMATHNKSMHSVSPVVFDGFRSCVSNYYFSKTPLLSTDTFHVTSFRGRPGQRLVDTVLQLDTWTRMIIRKFFKKGIKENPHVYKK